MIDHIRRAVKTAMSKSLGTSLVFEIKDMRGRNNFPDDERGFVYLYKDRRTVSDEYTGLLKKIHADYEIRTDQSGQWRIDERDMGIAVAVYGPGRREYFDSAVEAAHVLEKYLSR